MLGCCHLQFIRSAVHLEPDIAFNSFSNPPFLQFIRSANALLRRVGSRFEGKNRYPKASKGRQIQHGARRWALGSTREPPEKQGTRSFDRVLQGWSVRRTSSVYPRISIAVLIASAISSV